MSQPGRRLGVRVLNGSENLKVTLCKGVHNTGMLWDEARTYLNKIVYLPGPEIGNPVLPDVQDGDEKAKGGKEAMGGRGE